MHALFANHTVKHYHYLRDTMPHLVPRLKPATVINNNGKTDDKLKDVEVEDENARKFLEKIVTSAEHARPGGRVYTQLLEAAAVDLDRLAEMDLRVEGVARFSALYIRCTLLLKSITRELTLSPNGENSDSGSTITTRITLLHKNAQK